VTTRQLRRAAERQTAKQNRTETNRVNSQHSTGPRTVEGKSASSQNAFKHGLYSKELVVPGIEDPAELEALKADLRRDHQPANATEEILVNEMAEQVWRIRRYRRYETKLISCDDENGMFAILKMMPVIQRFMTAAERGFHKALTALRQLQKDRGFVPQNAETAQNKEETRATAAPGFVPQNLKKYSEAAEIRWAEAVTYHCADPSDTELRDPMARR